MSWQVAAGMAPWRSAVRNTFRSVAHLEATEDEVGMWYWSWIITSTPYTISPIDVSSKLRMGHRAVVKTNTELQVRISSSQFLLAPLSLTIRQV